MQRRLRAAEQIIKHTQKHMHCVTNILKNGDIDLVFNTKSQHSMCFAVDFRLSKPISVNLHHDQFRIVVDPYGQNAVSETSRNDLLHAADIVHSLIHLGEDLELG